MADAEDHWYYSSDGKNRHGPVPQNELQKLLRLGHISADALVWRPGFSDWRKIEEVKEIGFEAALAPAPLSKNEIDRDREEHSRPTEEMISASLPSRSQDTENRKVEQESEIRPAAKPHPWRRWCAKMVDVTVFILVAGFILGFFLPRVSLELALVFIEICNNLILANIFFFLLWIPAEALFLSLTGTTPARWLWGITVRTVDGRNVDFLTGVRRGFGVWCVGLAFSIPFVALFTQYFAYRRLAKTGTTRWDYACGIVVHHKQWGVGRALLCTLVFLALLLVLSALNSASY